MTGAEQPFSPSERIKNNVKLILSNATDEWANDMMWSELRFLWVFRATKSWSRFQESDQKLAQKKIELNEYKLFFNWAVSKKCTV